MTRSKAIRESLIMIITLLAIYQVFRSIAGSVQRQVFLHNEAIALRGGAAQAEEVNKELRQGLSSYQSSSGIERLARERLNLAGPGEIVVRIGR